MQYLKLKIIRNTAFETSNYNYVILFESINSNNDLFANDIFDFNTKLLFLWFL